MPVVLAIIFVVALCLALMPILYGLYYVWFIEKDKPRITQTKGLMNKIHVFMKYY
jgi:hypothetical protein